MPRRHLTSDIRCCDSDARPEQLRALLVRSAGAMMLESTAAHPRWGRFSIYAGSPVRVLHIREPRVDPFVALAALSRPWSEFAAAPRGRRHPDIPVPAEFPPPAMWIGYWSYESGAHIEPRMGRRGAAHPLPPAYWALFDTLLIFDHQDRRWWVAGVELDSTQRAVDRPTLNNRLMEAERWLDAARSSAGPAARLQPAVGPHSPPETSLEWDLSPGEYVRAVERALEYVRAGDVYQVNLSRRAGLPLSESPEEIYERLCRVNPAWFAAWMSIPPDDAGRGGGAILSASPELLIRKTGRDVLTRPIKGTRPRSGDPALDARAREELAASDKERAELNMIIDLERNDLGRVCEFGSIRVLSHGEPEIHPTVFHRTAAVAGRLCADADVIDLVRAVFPGGSVTGAPKVRAMQIIHELEPTPRGPYCGALGYIGLNGEAQLNLPIRTLCAFDGRAEMRVGSGIVVDSNPQAEYEELNAKALGMLRALGASTSEIE